MSRVRLKAGSFTLANGCCQGVPGTRNRYDPENLAVPMKAGTFVTHFGNRVHWDGAKDEDVTLLIIGEGLVTTARVDEAR